MGEVGILRPDERVELIDGEIIDMTPPGGRHIGMVMHLDRLLQRTVADAAMVLVQSPISLGHHSEPQPDVALLRPRPDGYKSGDIPQSADVLLVIEVAETSLRYDRDVKTALYARHEIPEIWLMDIRAKRLTRYRDPVGGTYRQVDEPDLGAPINLPAGSGLRIDLALLFAH